MQDRRDSDSGVHRQLSPRLRHPRTVSHRKMGGAFKKIAYALPFVHAVELERALISGNFGGIFPHLWWVLGYTVGAMVLAVLLFLRQMKKG